MLSQEKLIKTIHCSKLIEFHPTGDLNIQEIKRLLVWKSWNEDIRNYNSIWDLKSAKLQGLNFRNIQQLASFTATLRGEDNFCEQKTAVIVYSDADYCIARMLQCSLPCHENDGFEIFRELEEALEWLFPH